MPFPIVWGIPDGTPDEVLYLLRQDMVKTLQKEMKVPADFVHVFFPRDMLREPKLDGSEGGNTIYIKLDTGMFHDNPDIEAVQKVTTALAHTVWGAFGCLREVECMVGDSNPAYTSLVKAIM